MFDIVNENGVFLVNGLSLIDCESNGMKSHINWSHLLLFYCYCCWSSMPLCLVLQEMLLFFVCHLVISFVCLCECVLVVPTRKREADTNC